VIYRDSNLKQKEEWSMKLLRAFVAVLILIVALNLVGCCSGGKETEKVVVPTQSATPTLGKELEDLDAAYKKGAITKKDYEAGKKKLLEQGAEQPK
jgi:hypothetical protein